MDAEIREGLFSPKLVLQSTLTKITVRIDFFNVCYVSVVELGEQVFKGMIEPDSSNRPYSKVVDIILLYEGQDRSGEVVDGIRYKLHEFDENGVDPKHDPVTDKLYKSMKEAEESDEYNNSLAVVEYIKQNDGSYKMNS